MSFAPGDEDSDDDDIPMNYDETEEGVGSLEDAIDPDKQSENDDDDDEDDNDDDEDKANQEDQDDEDDDSDIEADDMPQAQKEEKHDTVVEAPKVEAATTGGYEAKDGDDLSVFFNRSYFKIPKGGILRGYDGQFLKVSSIDMLSDMVSSTSKLEHWPSVENIPASSIWVVQAKSDDGMPPIINWFIRIVVEGHEEDSDDKNILRHIPKTLSKRLIAHWQGGDLKESRLLSQFKPSNENQQFNPLSIGWNKIFPKPKTLSKNNASAKEPKIKMVATDGETIVPNPSAKRKNVEVDAREDASEKPTSSSSGQDATGKTLKRQKKITDSLSLKDLGKGPSKSSTTAPATAPAAAPASAPASAPAPAASNANDAKSRPRQTAKEAKEAKEKKDVSTAIIAPDNAEKKKKEPEAISDPRESGGSSSMEIDLGPNKTARRIDTIECPVIAAGEKEFTVNFPTWAKKFKIVVEFEG